jgi:hypothetical protein
MQGEREQIQVEHFRVLETDADLTS